MCVVCMSPIVFAHAFTKTAKTQQSPRLAQHAQAETFVADAITALERGDELAARALFERALKSNPNNVSAHTYLGVLADKSADLVTAERHFAIVARLNPQSASARNNYGAILLRAGHVEKAATEFLDSLRLDPRQPNALINLAQIRFRSGTTEDLRSALDLFRQAHAIAPELEVARAITITSLRLKDVKTAASFYEEYASLVANPARDAVTAESRAELGGALFEADLLEQAARELTAAVALDSSQTTTLVRLARVHLKRKDVSLAGRTLEAAAARGLDDAAIYAVLAEVYEAGGYVENAIPAMRLAIARDPKNESYRYRYGMLLTNTKAPAAAIIRLQESLAEFPRSAKIWFALGFAQLTYGKQDEAETSFRRASELDPKFATALAFVGTIHALRADYTAALGFYERALAVDDRLTVAYYLAAEALIKETDVDRQRVERYLTRAVELDPTFPAARVSLGKILTQQNRVDEAVIHFERALEYDSKYAEAYYQLGRAYQRLKRTDDAQKMLALFKELNEQQRREAPDKLSNVARRLADVRF